MNEELKKLVEWLNANKLSLNVRKTHYVIFTPGRHNVSPRENIYMKGELLQREYCTTFLGVKIDHKLTWKHHIQHIKSKIAKMLAFYAEQRVFFKLLL